MLTNQSNEKPHPQKTQASRFMAQTLSSMVKERKIDDIKSEEIMQKKIKNKEKNGAFTHRRVSTNNQTQIIPVQDHGILFNQMYTDNIEIIGQRTPRGKQQVPLLKDLNLKLKMSHTEVHDIADVQRSNTHEKINLKRDFYLNSSQQISKIDELIGLENEQVQQFSQMFQDVQLTPQKKEIEDNQIVNYMEKIIQQLNQQNQATRDALSILAQNQKTLDQKLSNFISQNKEQSSIVSNLLAQQLDEQQNFFYQKTKENFKYFFKKMERKVNNQKQKSKRIFLFGKQDRIDETIKVQFKPMINRVQIQEEKPEIQIDFENAQNQNSPQKKQLLNQNLFEIVEEERESPKSRSSIEQSPKQIRKPDLFKSTVNRMSMGGGQILQMIREEELKRKQIHDSKDKPSRTENKDFQIPSADDNIHSVSEIDLPDIDELILGLNQEDEQTNNQPDIDQLIAFCQEEQEEFDFQQVTVDEAISNHELNTSCVDSESNKLNDVRRSFDQGVHGGGEGRQRRRWGKSIAEPFGEKQMSASKSFIDSSPFQDSPQKIQEVKKFNLGNPHEYHIYTQN